MTGQDGQPDIDGFGQPGQQLCFPELAAAVRGKWQLVRQVENAHPPERIPAREEAAPRHCGDAPSPLVPCWSLGKSTARIIQYFPAPIFGA